MTKDEEWISSAAALRMLVDNGVHTEPEELLLRRLKAGMLQARAPKFYPTELGFENSIVAPSFWGDVDEIFAKLDWQAGDFEFGSNDASRFAYGVRFRRDQVEEICGIRPSSTILKKVSGTRRYAKWDDMLIEVARALFVKELVPKRQVDLVEFMLDWASHNDFDVSQSAVKSRAKLLWDGISKTADSLNN